MEMSSSTLKRWSGLAAVIGGGLFVVLSVAESLLFPNQPYSEVAASGAWLIVQGAYILAAILINLSLVGLYTRQAEEVGSLGLIAFLVTFIGGMMAAGATWSEAFFGSWLAGATPELLDSDPAGVVVAGAVLSFVLFALGWFLFGLVSLRARLFPRGAAIVLMIGAVLFAVLGALELPFAGVAFGAGLAWMGYGLYSRTANQPRMMAEAPT
jgi:hypothetical protein